MRTAELSSRFWKTKQCSFQLASILLSDCKSINLRKPSIQATVCPSFVQEGQWTKSRRYLRQCIFSGNAAVVILNQITTYPIFL
jgi:hypothetical protein